MSAYIVERNHILYLVEAALHWANPYGFSWRDGQAEEGHVRKEMRGGDLEKAVEAANMLWRENVKSVKHRYRGEQTDTLPGSIGTDEEHVITMADMGNGELRWSEFDCAQVFKAADCYAYQTCEHEDWPKSEAYSFIESLRGSAWHALPGYEAAEWGAPKTNAELGAPKQFSLSRMVAAPKTARPIRAPKAQPQLANVYSTPLPGFRRVGGFFIAVSAPR